MELIGNNMWEEWKRQNVKTDSSIQASVREKFRKTTEEATHGHKAWKLTDYGNDGDTVVIKWMI